MKTAQLNTSGAYRSDSAVIVAVVFLSALAVLLMLTLFSTAEALAIAGAMATWEMAGRLGFNATQGMKMFFGVTATSIAVGIMIFALAFWGQSFYL